MRGAAELICDLTKRITKIYSSFLGVFLSAKY